MLLLYGRRTYYLFICVKLNKVTQSITQSHVRKQITYLFPAESECRASSSAHVLRQSYDSPLLFVPPNCMTKRLVRQIPVPLTWVAHPTEHNHLRFRVSDDQPRATVK